MKSEHILVLASSSPRRRALLDSAGILYEVDAPQLKESFDSTPIETVLHLSGLKARAVASKHDRRWILSADTVVSIDGKILGKPHGRNEAERMLRMLAGRWHQVYTGVCLLDSGCGRMLREAVETRVHFLPISTNQMEAYLETDEPYDKAGAYAIQGRAGAFIDRIEGSYSNVVGLPVHTVFRLMDLMEKE